jgi:hypothetical protein
VGDFLISDWTDVCGVNSHDSRGIAAECREFDLVRSTVGVDVHDGPDVSRFEPFAWLRFRQHDSIVFLDVSHVVSLEDTPLPALAHQPGAE